MSSQNDGKGAVGKDGSLGEILYCFSFFSCRSINGWLLWSDFSYFGGAESLSEGRTPRRTSVTAPSKLDDGKSFTGPPQDPNDFLWLMTEEPHRSRRTAIIKAHPEVYPRLSYNLSRYAS